ncbi:hypothetical protein FH972_023429 [Carpinus fangiana]|uniref:Transcription factor domain-containing protein n=1 Tax=Carpinus fangiana TaxID=176857 RepID=A0A5N6KVJ8_9ROSI|nr:hypothetical protein FH972_023429 [Carpinus fangiana]
MPAEPGNLQNLSRALHRSMPHRNDIRLLCQISSQYPTLLGAHLTRSYTTLQCHGLKAADGILGEPPLQTVHPVLIARYMLQLAIMLQDMHLEVQSELSSLSESVSDIMQRCANAAVSLVTTRDEVLGSIESLECVMLESVYRCNSGHLKLSWIAARRAMILAQTMGLHLQDAERKTTLKVLDSTATHVEPQTLWFRIVTYDLLMCRMLGLPPGITDAYSAHFFLDPGTALGHLENKHCNIMNQILKRKRPGSGLPDFEKTLLLDQELQRAAKAVPSDWWLAPHLSESSKDPVAIFWDVRRLLVQTIHYDLFNQLYVPYMLDQGQSATDRQRCNLSRIVCVNSSREVLSRYILLRNFNHVASSCRIVDFMGLMASITLALAHLGGRHQLSDNISVQSCNLLLHQAPSDRAMMEEALKRMRQVSQLSGDAISARSADTLRRLMDIESETADHEAKDHINVHAELVSDDIEFQNDVLDVDDAERIDVPYFGFIRIIRERENLHSPPALTMPVEEHHQNTNDTAAEHYTLEPGLGKNVSNLQPPLHSYGTIPPDLNDEHWDFQNIHLSFLDDFFDNLPRNETIRDS